MDVASNGGVAGLQVRDPASSFWDYASYILGSDNWYFDGYPVGLNGKIMSNTRVNMWDIGNNPVSWFIGGEARSAPKLFRSALGAFKETKFTNVGRALTKHPDILGFESFEALTGTLRSAEAINGAASGALKTILRNGTRTTTYAKRLGQTVIQYRLASGYGARWTMAGDFVGFITP